MAGIMNAGLSVRLVLTLEYDLSLYSLSTGSPNASMADSRQCLNRAVLGSCPLSSVLCLVSNWGVLTRISGQPDAPQTSIKLSTLGHGETQPSDYRQHRNRTCGTIGLSSACKSCPALVGTHNGQCRMTFRKGH